MKKSVKPFLVMLVIALGLMATACAPNRSAPAANQKQEKENYPSNNITFIVPFSPGGGYDTLVRAAAPLLTQNLPNHPNIVVKNVSTGSGKVGVEELYSSKPDGYTIGIMSGGAVIPQIIEDAKYDLNKMEWLGIMSTDYYITAASKKSNIHSLDDLRKKQEVSAGVTSLSTIDGIGPYVMADKMGFKIKATGHQGSKEATLAAIRGDVDMVTYPVSSMLNLVKNGDLVPLWVSSPERLADLPNAPTLKELGFENVAKVLVLPRPIGISPNTPKEKVDVLKAALQKVFEDKQFQDLVVNKNQAALGTVDTAKTKEIVSSLFDLLQPYKDLLKSETK